MNTDSDGNVSVSNNNTTNKKKIEVVSLLDEDSDDDDDITVNDEGEENGNDGDIIVNKPSKSAEEARETNTKDVVPETPVKDTTVEKTVVEGTNENNNDNVVGTENIDKIKIGVTPTRLVQFTTGHGTPISTISMSTPSSNNIYSQ